MIDIVMPCYNSEDTISDVLDGVQKQTYQDFELYIINNSCTDNTVKTIQSHPISNKVKLINNDENIGFVRNVRKALSCGTREYTALCSSNDILYPTYLESLLSMHDKNTSATYALCDFYIDGKFFRRARPEDYFDTTGLNRTDACNLVMKKFTYSAPFWSLYKKNVLTKMSPFAFNRGADHVHVAEAALYGDIKRHSQPLFQRNYPAGRSADAFSLMENDQQLGVHEINKKMGWHLFPYISMLRSHHNMIRRSFILDNEKESLFKSSAVILATRFQKEIIREIKRFMEIEKKPPRKLIEMQYFHEIESNIKFILNFIKLEKKK